MSETKRMTIGKLAQQAGVGVETVRFYQRKALLELPQPQGKVRYYDDTHAQRLRFIKKAQVAGFSLAEIAELLALDATDDRTQARVMATQRLAKLNAQIAELESARASLEFLIDECATKRGGCCPILAAFDEKLSA